MGELLSEVDLREISERCDQVETIIGPPGTQDSAEEWCYLLRSHEISPLCDEAQCDIRRLIAAYAELRARLESAASALREAEAALRELEQRNSFVWEGETARQCGICHWRYTEKAHSATCPFGALGAAGERSEG